MNLKFGEAIFLAVLFFVGTLVLLHAAFADFASISKREVLKIEPAFIGWVGQGGTRIYTHVRLIPQEGKIWLIQGQIKGDTGDLFLLRMRSSMAYDKYEFDQAFFLVHNVFFWRFSRILFSSCLIIFTVFAFWRSQCNPGRNIWDRGDRLPSIR